MKAAITKGKQNLVVEEMQRPELEQGEALVQVKYTGICGTDEHIYNGSFPLLNYPIVPGHEFVGKLVDIKFNRKLDIEPGDWVVAHPFFSCYACDACLQGGDNYCTSIQVLGVHKNGSMAEYVKVPANKLVKVNKDADKKLVALTEPLAVGVYAVTKGDLKIGNTAFVIGAGVIGIMIALAARIAGASKVVLCDINDYRLDFVRSLGFTALNSSEEGFFERLMDLTDGKGYNNVFEATGTAFGVKTMTDACKRGGIIVQCGITTASHPLHIRSFSDKEVQIRGIRISAFSCFKAALDIIQRGELKTSFERIITNVFPLDRAAEAMAFLKQDDKHLKVLVENPEI